jgi:hypothetical protein
VILLREKIESDLAVTLEGHFKLPVVLIDPDGVKYDKSANDPELDLVGQILYDTRVEDPETGGEIIVHKPVVTLRRTSLTRVPQPLEKWVVQIPIRPFYDDPKVSFVLERPSEEGGAIGFIRLYLTRAEQAA